MARIQSAYILQRIREVIEDGAGTLRPVTDTRFAGNLPEGLDDEEAMRRTLGISAPVEAAIVGIKRSASSPPVLGNYALYELEILVKVMRMISPLEHLDDDSRVLLQSYAIEDADVLAQALEYPGNLTTTTAGFATQIVSGMLRYVSSRVVVKRPIVDGSQPLETLHTFTCHAYSRPATS